MNPTDHRCPTDRICPTRAVDRLRARLRRRGQGGFAVMAGLLVWMLVGGVTMAALLNMTLSANQQAANDATRAQQLRAIDSALETTVVAIQVDPSGRVVAAAGDGTCVQQPGTDEGLFYEDGRGRTVQVTATCFGDADQDADRTVSLTARIVDPATASLLVGSARLLVEPLKGPGNQVTVLSWSLTAPPDDADLTTTTTSTTTTVAPTTTTTTPTTTSTTPSGVSWTSRVTSEWQSGYCVEVTVTNNNRNTEKWTVQVPVKGSIYAFWNGRYTRSGDTLTVVGEQWNQSLKRGESASFGWCSTF